MTNRNRIRTLTFILTLGIASLAMAQDTTFSAEVVAMYFANETDSVTMDCPSHWDRVTDDKACFRMDTSMSLSRSLLDLTISTSTDSRWILPWTNENGVYARVLQVDGVSSTYGFFLTEHDDWETDVMVVQFPDD